MPTREREFTADKWLLCGLLLLATMINYMDRMTLSQLSPQITKELEISDRDYGFVDTGFSLAFAAGGLVMGFLADRSSVRWMYPAVLISWSAAGMATAWASNFGQVLACRIALGFFESGQWPCALITCRRLLSRENRVLGNSVLQSGAAIGAIITPILTRVIATEEEGGWRSPFVIIGLVGMVWVGPWLWFTRRAGLEGRLTSEELPPEALDSTADSEASRRRAEVSSTLRTVVSLAMIVVGMNVCWHFFRHWLPKFLERSGYDSNQRSWIVSMFYLSADVGCLSIGALSSWMVRRGVSLVQTRARLFLVCGMMTSMTYFVALPLPGAPLAGAPLLILLCVIAFGAMGVFPIYYSLTQELPARFYGQFSGLLGLFAWIAVAIMQPLAGAWFDYTGSYDLVLGASGAGPLVAYLVLRHRWRYSKCAISREPDGELFGQQHGEQRQGLTESSDYRKVGKAT